MSPAQCDVMWCTMYSTLDDVYVFLVFLISLLHSFHLCLFVLQTLYISDIVCTHASVHYTLTEVSRYYFIRQLQLLTILLWFTCVSSRYSGNYNLVCYTLTEFTCVSSRSDFYRLWATPVTHSDDRSPPWPLNDLCFINF